MGNTPRRRVHPFAATTYVGRIIITAVGSLMVATVVWTGNPVLATVLLAFGLIYPHVMYRAAVRGDSRRIGLLTFFVDSFIMGIWVVLLAYALIPSLAISVVVFSVALLMGGLSLAIRALIPFTVVISTGWLWVEPSFWTHSDGIPFYLATFLILVYVIYITWLTNRFGFDLITARKNLEAQNEKIRSQAALLESMNQVAHLVNSTLELEEVARAIKDGLADIVEFDQMGVLFLTESRDALELKEYLGGNAPEAINALLGLRIPMSEEHSIFVATVNARKPRYVADTAAVRDLMSPADVRIYEAVPTRSIVTFPLVIDNQAMGVLSFSHSQRQFLLEPQDIATIGRYVAFVATAVRKVQLNEGLVRAQHEAIAANEAKSQFLANMSHELRTPMNAIIGYTEMLIEDAEDGGLDGFVTDLGKIHSASRHLLELINSLLDLSKIEAGRMEIYVEPVRIDEFVAELAATMEPLVKNNGNSFVIEHDDAPAEVHADVMKLRQAALNLLANANKFTRDGEVTLKARGHRHAGRTWLDLMVTDTGIGMNEEQLERVFQPFTQADAATTRNYGGTGLGLTISKGFCELMGGTILVESSPGSGSTFTIRIPADAP